MALNPTSPTTGSAVTGLTSPTYTWTEDSTDVNSRRFVVTALGGTQTNVEVHSVSSPFYITVSRPKELRTLPRANASGMYPQIPVNEFRVKLVKGCTINSQVAGVSSEAQILGELRIRVPAGAELSNNDPEEISAGLSFLAGFLNANASGVVDLIKTGLLK